MDAENCLLLKDLQIPSDDFECEFCSLELGSSKEWNEHLLQHFQQRVCSGCRKILICIGDIWYGPHIDSNCCSFPTDVRFKTPEEVILPDFIEIKQEVFDADDEINDVTEANDIFNDTQFMSDNEEYDNDNTNEAEDDVSNYCNKIGAGETTSYSFNAGQIGQEVKHEKNIIFHMNNGFERNQRSAVVLKKQKKAISTVPSYASLSETSAGLTDEQLSSRKCPICHKIIVNKQNLICHMNIHNGKKPFVCSVCNKSFAHIRNLIRHKEQQGHCEMEFKCAIMGCKKSFMSNNKLQRHVKLAHLKYEIVPGLEKPYPCDQCDKSFMTLGFLNMHLRQVHNNQ